MYHLSLDLSKQFESQNLYQIIYFKDGYNIRVGEVSYNIADTYINYDDNTAVLPVINIPLSIFDFNTLLYEYDMKLSITLDLNNRSNISFNLCDGGDNLLFELMDLKKSVLTSKNNIDEQLQYIADNLNKNRMSYFEISDMKKIDVILNKIKQSAIATLINDLIIEKMIIVSNMIYIDWNEVENKK